MDQEKVVSKMRKGWILNKYISNGQEHYTISLDMNSSSEIIIKPIVARLVLSYISDICNEAKIHDGHYIYKLNK